MMPSQTTMGPIARHTERARVIFAGICSLILSVGLARFAYTPMLTIMHQTAGLSDVTGGWLATINYAGYMVGVFIVTTLHDPKRKFQLYRIGLVMAVVSTAAMGMTDNVVLWAIWRFIAGLSSIAGSLLASGLVLNWLIRHGHRPTLGLHFTGLGLGIAISGIAVAGLVDYFDWQGQWVGLGILGVVFFIPAWYWLPAPAASQTHPAQSMTVTPPSTRWMGLLISAYFCAGFGYVISATFIVAILEKLPLLAGRGSWVWVMVGLAAVVSCFIWDPVAHRIGQVPALLLSFALQTVSIILPVLTANVALNILSAILYGGTFVGIVSLTLSLVGRYFPANPARAMARLTLSYGVAQIIAPAMAGYIAAATGGYHGALIVTAIIMVIGVLLLLALQKQRG